MVLISVWRNQAAVNHWAFTKTCNTIQKLFPPVSTDNRFLTTVSERLKHRVHQCSLSLCTVTLFHSFTLVAFVFDHKVHLVAALVFSTVSHDLPQQEEFAQLSCNVQNAIFTSKAVTEMPFFRKKKSHHKSCYGAFDHITLIILLSDRSTLEQTFLSHEG